MINNVVLVGRLTKDPDLRYTANGTGVATFTLAVNRNFTNQSGNREADFINPLSQLRTLCLTSIEIQIHLVDPLSTFQMMIYHSNN